MLLAPMAYRQLSDKEEIRARLQLEVDLHIYELGDLDDFFWPHTQYFAGAGDATLLLYTGSQVPCLLALSSERENELIELIEQLLPILPDHLQAHVSNPLVPLLRKHYPQGNESHNKKMRLLAPDLVGIDTARHACEWLDPSNLEEVLEYYREAYPGNWFEPRMLETGMYTCIRSMERLQSVAGVHVYSATERIAALGNIATMPSARGEGLARSCTSALCARLFEQVDRVGLNVKGDNVAAIACYAALGFQHVADYVEMSLSRD